jgi:hypothetical protein
LMSAGMVQPNGAGPKQLAALAETASAVRASRPTTAPAAPVTPP